MTSTSSFLFVPFSTSVTVSAVVLLIRKKGINNKSLRRVECVNKIIMVSMNYAEVIAGIPFVLYLKQPCK